jgi:hypothetical protein
MLCKQIKAKVLEKNSHFFLGTSGIILATQESEIRRMVVGSQPGQIVHKTLSPKTQHKKSWWSGSSDRVPA